MSHAAHHITSVKTLTAVILALAVLTILTVVIAQVDLGPLHVAAALLIAGVKASLVVAIFMGLKYDNKTNALILAIGLIMVTVSLLFVLLDTSFRGDTSATTKGTIGETEQMAPAAESQH